MKSYPVQANALSIPLASGSVQCIVTSPPFYGLRDYSEAAQIGLEPTLQEYTTNLVSVFDECWRVLRDDGVLWLNLGDSYTSGGRKTRDPGKSELHPAQQKGMERPPDPAGLKPKDLMGVPWRVAFALQERGWWLRSDIIWHKQNPMPESVTDRPTKSHEYIFLLTKNKNYYYDADAIRENKAESTTSDKRNNVNGHRRDRNFPGSPSVGGTNLGGATGGRNKRSVWTITTRSYSGAHFATFPPQLPEICIKAGTSEKGECPECGKPWERVTERKRYRRDELPKGDPRYRPNRYEGAYKDINGKGDAGYTTSKTLGWRPTCGHYDDQYRSEFTRSRNARKRKQQDAGKYWFSRVRKLPGLNHWKVVPQTVLDIFGGSGTTAMVARNLGRVGICLDLSMKYLQLAQERLGITALADWQNGNKKAEANWQDTPLFKKVT